MTALVEVRLGAFVDFVSANGRARLTVVRNAKTRYAQTYDPATDYWGPLRKATVKVLLEGWSKASPEELMAASDDPKKLENYRACVEGLRRFVGRKDIAASRARRVEWTSGDLAVSVDPELRLVFDGKTVVTKLYFKRDEIKKRQVDAVLYLMSQTVAQTAIPAILDVQRGRLVMPTVQIPDMDVLLAGEAAAFAQMWQRL